ncbi:MAG: CBS domain-containing protein [Desulfobulbaceae bacterium]|nr:CBS domain-containing protein [Desulfobulbaceae bacterium]
MGLNDTISAAINKNAPAVSGEESLRNVIDTMARANVSALVVKDGNEVMGLITTMDVMNCVAKGRDLGQTKVAGSMTPCSLITGQGGKRTPCVQLDEAETIGNALAIMNEAGVHNLLVSGANNQAIGTVSVLDLLKLAIA